MRTARSSDTKSNKFRFKILEGDDGSIRERRMNVSPVEATLVSSLFEPSIASSAESSVESSVASLPSEHNIASPIESSVTSLPSEHTIESSITSPPSEHDVESSIASPPSDSNHGVMSTLFAPGHFQDNAIAERDTTNNISQSISNIVRPDETWNYETFAHEGYRFNDTQLSIVYNVLKYGNTSPLILKPLSNPKKFYENPLIYGFNSLTNDYHTLYKTYYTIDTDKPELIDSLLHTYNIVDQGRNLYIQNCYRSYIYNTIAENTIIPITARFRKHDHIAVNFTDVHYILTRIRNGYFKQKNQNVDPFIVNAQALILAQAVLNANPTTYVKGRSPTSYKSPRIKELYELTLIPKDLQAKFNKPAKYFEEIKPLLTLNSDGFYTYNLNGVMIPVLCTHEYMIYEGKSLSLVSLECYKDGKCKYCGQDLLAYHIQYKEAFPPKVYDLIYKYMNTINENIEETSLLNALFLLLHDAIDNNVTGSNVKNYDTAVVAFSALYLYSIYMKTKNDISYNNKINRFIDSAKNYWSEIGWTDQDIDEALKNENINSNLANITDIIKEKIYTTEFKFIDQLPIAVLFNTIVALKDYYSITATTPSQKLWNSGEAGMSRFYSILRCAYLSLWGNVLFKNILSKLQNKHIPIISSRFNIVTTVVKNGQRFFNSTCLYYCPVNHIHEWSLKKECLHCGLKANKSNVSIVYDKYQHAINNSFLQQPKILPPERFLLDKIHHVKDILAYDANGLFEKYINIDNTILRNAILKSMDQLDRVKEYIKFISVVTTIDISELNAIDDKKTLILKALSFIIDKGIKSKENVIAEIKNITFKMSNIELLLM